MQEELQNWQKKPFKETISKRRKKKIQQPSAASLARSQQTKSRNRFNAELDRYKRRLLFQYLKCLPYLTILQNQKKCAQIKNQHKQKNQQNSRLLSPSQVHEKRQHKNDSENNQLKQQSEVNIREKAMKLAIENFLKFHNLHIVEKTQNNQKFTLQSIRPQIRKQFMNFIKKLLSYTNEQLFQIDQKNLLDHSFGNAQKKHKLEPMTKQKCKKQKTIQNKNNSADLFTNIEQRFISFPVIILPQQTEQAENSKPKLNIFNKSEK